MRQHKCPKCGTDVMQTGFDVVTIQSEMWMSIGGRPQRVTGSEMRGPMASCSACGKPLNVEFKDLVQAVAA